MVIAGGHQKKRPIKGRVGKLVKFVGHERQRAIVEGLNMVTRHQKAKGPGTSAARIQKEAPIHVSRLMYYVEKLKRPVRLKHSVLTDGTKVRGYSDPSTKQFIQLEN